MQFPPCFVCSTNSCASNLLELLPCSEVPMAVCLLPFLCLSDYDFPGNVSMWNVSAMQRARGGTYKLRLLCLSAKLALIYTSSGFDHAIDEELQDLPKTCSRDTPRNLPRDWQSVSPGSLQLSTDECNSVSGVKMIMAEALLFLRALQFLFITFYTHLYNKWCLASHHVQEAFCLFRNRVSLDITKFMILFPHP